MKIQSAEFLTSVAHISQLPRRGYPEIAFAGRSNVGKSSLINCLLNRKKLAKTSSTPGKTRLLNFYHINMNVYFVDLPGYGFAKVAKNERQKWKTLVESYFMTSRFLKCVIIIIDSRHDLSPLDRNMIEWVTHLEIPKIIVATKADKLSSSQLQKNLTQKLKQIESFGVSEIIPFSAVTRNGKKTLWQALDQILIKDVK